jgi:hypothetical protein
MKLKIYKQLIFETYSPLVAYPQMISYTKKIWVKMDYCRKYNLFEVELLLLIRFLVCFIYIVFYTYYLLQRYK